MIFISILQKVKLKIYKVMKKLVISQFMKDFIKY